MRVPVKWIRDYVDIDISAKELADALTMTGTKAETIEYLGEEISNVVVGKIMSIEKHPDADKLQVTQIDVGKDELVQIVTGAQNVSVGDVVPVALHKSTLPGGIKITKGKLRGVESNGMLCSCKELDVEEKYMDEKSKNGIWILDSDLKIGQDIRDALDLKDAIIEFELTANRPDCMSMIGIALETSSTINKPINLPENKFNEIDEEFDFEVSCEDEALCPRYMLRKIKDVKIEPSPYFMQRRLIEAGVRPINNIVDITNYVMLEYGQPMHAFDAKMLETDRIVVKRAKDGEKFVTLDDVERQLDSSMLMITDGIKSIAIAGVMGGQNSEITDDTTEVVFESANFEQDSVRLTSKKLGLRTDSSSRFEKGIDIQRPELAIERACYFIDKYGWGKVVKGQKDTLKEKIEKREITVNAKKIIAKLGNDIEIEQVIKILEKLFFEVSRNGDELILKVPFNRNDIYMSDDILEEVARIYGYNNIISKNITSTITFGEKTPQKRFEDSAKIALMSNGLTEVITYSFIGEKDLDMINFPKQNLLKIINPLGEDTSIMRTTLVPSMMNVVKRNYSRKNEFFAGFEIGHIFIKEEDKIEPTQKKQLVGAVYGDKTDFFDLKSMLEGAFENLGIFERRYEIENTNELFHTQRCAKISVKDNVIGYIGELHPIILDNYDIKKRVYMFVIDFDILFESKFDVKLAKNVSKFPAIKRDIAFVIDEKVLCNDIQDLIEQNSNDIVESIELFDIYSGSQVEKGKKSMAYSIIYRGKDRTLTDEEVNPVQENIINKLKEKFDAYLRM